MADEWIKVGSQFTVTLNTVDPITGLPLITLTDWSGHLVKYRRPDGYHFVRVHTLMRILAEKFFHFFKDCRHTGLTADENDFINVFC